MDREIVDIIKQSRKEEYKDIIEKSGELKVLNALSTIRRNIINWYPFKFDATLLEINTNFGEITEELCTRVKKVVTIENSKEKVEAINKRLEKVKNVEIINEDLNNINFEEVFDYIIINSVEENDYSLEQYLEFSKRYLKEDGTILFTCDNKFGLKTYNVNLQENNTKKYLSGDKIKNIIQKAEFYNCKFYYPLPNYKTPNVIFTDKYLPNSETIVRDFTLYDKDEILVFDERNKYKEILKENRELFKFFANSFLVEISKVDNKIQFVSFNNSRKDRYKIKTVLLDDIAYKQNINEDGKEHFKHIKNNIKILNDLDINILDTYDENKIYSKLIKEEDAFDKILIHKFKEGKIEQAYELIEKFILEITQKLYDEKQKVNKTIFQKLNIEISQELSDKLHYVKYGLFDLIFQNCFYIENEFYFYDQEWIEEGIPVEFIIYRAIEYLANASRTVNKNELFEKFNITEYIEPFSKIETILQEEIKDEFMWKMHALNQNTVKSIYETQVHYRNLNAILQQEKAQEKNVKEKEIQQKQTEIQQNEQMIHELTNELRIIKNSRSWKLMTALRKLRGKK